MAGRLIATLGGGGKGSGGPTNRSKPQSTASPGFQKQHMVGTVTYMPPEVLMRRVPGFSADAYAFGVSACEVATGIAPYSDRERNVALAHTIMDLSLQRGRPGQGDRGENLRPSLPSETAEGSKNASAAASPSARVAAVAADGVSRLAAACWAPDASARPSFGDVQKDLDDDRRRVQESRGSRRRRRREPRWSPPTAATRDAAGGARRRVGRSPTARGRRHATGTYRRRADSRR